MNLKQLAELCARVEGPVVGAVTDDKWKAPSFGPMPYTSKYGTWSADRVTGLNQRLRAVWKRTHIA